MSEQAVKLADRMGLADRVHYTFNSIMSMKVEMMMNEEKTDDKIQSIAQELNVLTKLVNEIREILGFRSEDTTNFIDDEAIEVDQDEIDDQGETEPDVTYPTTTSSSNKKRRLE